MPGVESPALPPEGGFPIFTPEDIVKLHAASMLSLTAALDAAGLVAREDVGRILAQHLTGQEREPWAQVVNALSRVLLEPKATPDRGASAEGPPTLTLIQGGVAVSERFVRSAAAPTLA